MIVLRTILLRSPSPNREATSAPRSYDWHCLASARPQSSALPFRRSSARSVRAIIRSPILQGYLRKRYIPTHSCDQSKDWNSSNSFGLSVQKRRRSLVKKSFRCRRQVMEVRFSKPESSALPAPTDGTHSCDLPLPFKASVHDDADITHSCDLPWAVPSSQPGNRAPATAVAAAAVLLLRADHSRPRSSMRSLHP